MSTQYDAIQAPYDEIRKSSIALIERANVREAVAPFIKDARVLDLACRTGFYSHHFLKWEASKVVGVDISSR
jgi:ubiquinone/menaquinone biosynthesis C-methylase UbiE